MVDFGEDKLVIFIILLNATSLNELKPLFINIPKKPVYLPTLSMSKFRTKKLFCVSDQWYFIYREDGIF